MVGFCVSCGATSPGPIPTPPPTPACAANSAVAESPDPALPASSAAAVTAPPTSAAPSGYPRFDLKGTLVRELASTQTGKQHSLIISVPDSAEKNPTVRYPVVYLLDAQWDFPLVYATVGKLHFDKLLPEMVLVGLSYGGNSPDYGALRSDDYLPTRAKGRDGNERGGGAPRFLSWLETDVFPLIEREYRGDPNQRILAGISHGGHFTLYALFEKPELFAGYIAANPSVGWNERELFRREKAFRAAHPKLERRLWLSSGSEESPDYLADELGFFKQITQSRYQGLALKVHSVPGGRHASSEGESFTRGLRFIAEPLLAGALKQ